MTSPSPPGRIVLLNGPSSAGKSTLARAIQRLSSAPWLHVSLDAFLAMLPPAYVGGHVDGFQFRDTPEGLSITNGPTALRVLRGMHRAIAALARAGNDLVVDHVLLYPDTTADFFDAVASMPLVRVAVSCPIDVLEARERSRGDRVAGMARFQAARAAAACVHDLEVDTSREAAEAAAARILAHVPPAGFQPPGTS